MVQPLRGVEEELIDGAVRLFGPRIGVLGWLRHDVTPSRASPIAAQPRLSRRSSTLCITVVDLRPRLPEEV